MAHWRVKFTQRGWEPPRPFGKTSEVVCAVTRDEAKAQVQASPYYPVTASKVSDDEKVTFLHVCRCEKKE